MGSEENMAEKVAGKLDEVTAKLGGPADRREGDQPGYEPTASEAEVEKLAARHGDRLIEQPDGSHVVESVEDVEVETPASLTELGTWDQSEASADDETDTLGGAGLDHEDTPTNS